MKTTDKTTSKLGKSNTVSKIVFIVLFVTLVLYVVTLAMPLLWSIITSFKERSDFVGNTFGLPEKWMFSNYGTVLRKFYVEIGGLKKVYFGGMILNTLIIAVGGSFVATLSRFIAAYATAKFNNRFSKIIYGIVMVTMILPIVGSLPSQINIMKNLHLYDSFAGIFISSASFLGLYFMIFHAAFKSMPNDFAEAAYIDGAGNFRVLISIVFPMNVTLFFTVMLLFFISSWNDYNTALIFLPSHPTLSYGMLMFEKNTDTELSSVPMKLAGCIMLLMPILVVFLIFHDKLIGNISLGGLKE